MGEVTGSRAARVTARCRELARVTDVSGETTRLFLSPATRDAHTLVGWWMRRAGLEVRVDDVGSLRGLRRAASNAGEDAPTLVLFSHLDTVPNAGAFDGPLGVLLGLAVARRSARLAWSRSDSQAVAHCGPTRARRWRFTSSKGLCWKPKACPWAWWTGSSGSRGWS